MGLCYGFIIVTGPETRRALFQENFPAAARLITKRNQGGLLVPLQRQ
jgi:hypothetical protein